MKLNIAQKRAARDLALAEEDEVLPLRELVEDGLLRVGLLAVLVHVATGRPSRPTCSLPPSGFSSPMIILKSVVLPAPFGPMMPTMPPFGRSKVRSSKSSLSPNAFFTPSALHDDVAEPRARRDVDLVRLAARLDAALGDELLVGREAGLALGLPRARRHAHPLELALERALARALGLLLDLEPRLLLLEPRGVVALPRDARAAVELEDPARDVVEEVAVVRDGDDRARELLEELLEPRDGLGVEVVRGLVEEEHVGLLDRRRRQSATRRFSPPEIFVTSASGGGQRSASIAISSVRSSSQPFAASIASCTLPYSAMTLSISASGRVSPIFSPSSSNRVEERLDRRDALLDVLENGLLRVELRVLREVADARALGRKRLAGELLVQPRHDPQHRGLAGAVEPEDRRSSRRGRTRGRCPGGSRAGAGPPSGGSAS